MKNRAATTGINGPSAIPSNGDRGSWLFRTAVSGYPFSGSSSCLLHDCPDHGLACGSPTMVARFVWLVARSTHAGWWKRDRGMLERESRLILEGHVSAVPGIEGTRARRIVGDSGCMGAIRRVGNPRTAGEGDRELDS